MLASFLLPELLEHQFLNEGHHLVHVLVSNEDLDIFRVLQDQYEEFEEVSADVVAVFAEVEDLLQDPELVGLVNAVLLLEAANDVGYDMLRVLLRELRKVDFEVFIGVLVLEALVIEILVAVGEQVVLLE